MSVHFFHRSSTPFLLSPHHLAWLSPAPPVSPSSSTALPCLPITQHGPSLLHFSQPPVLPSHTSQIHECQGYILQPPGMCSICEIIHCTKTKGLFFYIPRLLVVHDLGNIELLMKLHVLGGRANLLMFLGTVLGDRTFPVKLSCIPPVSSHIFVREYVMRSQ